MSCKVLAKCMIDKIMELYKEGYISSPGFSIIITSSNINRLYLGDIMKNEYVESYLLYNDNMNKGECSIIENETNWVCKVKYVEYNALKYKNWERHKESSKSIVKFDIKENKLVIPDKYYAGDNQDSKLHINSNYISTNDFIEI